MNRFIIENTPIDGLQIIQRQPIGDARGYLESLFCTDELKALIGNRSIVQINHTLTAKAGTVRGMQIIQDSLAIDMPTETRKDHS